MNLSDVENIALRDAMGIGWRRSVGPTGRVTAKTPWRNRFHCVANRDVHAVARSLAGRGLMVRDLDADYGSILIYRVTHEGAKAVGAKLPANLAALIPAASPPLAIAAE